MAIALTKPSNAGWKETLLSALPTVTACYAIYLSGELIYIGKAKDLRKRFRHHQISMNRICGRRFEGDPNKISIKFRPCCYSDVDRREVRLIRRLTPRLNHAFNKRNQRGSA